MLGSQIFDYWFDPSKFILVRDLFYKFMFIETHHHQEHYSDGDLVNSQTKVSHVEAGPQALKIWGPPVPSVF